MITIICSVICFFIIFFYNIFLHKKCNNFIVKIQLLENDNLKFRKEIRLLNSSIINVGQYLNKIETYLQRLTIRQDTAELKQSATASYSHAAKIIEIGGTVKDIVEGCALSQAEAELVAMLHKKNTGAS